MREHELYVKVSQTQLLFNSRFSYHINNTACGSPRFTGYSFINEPA